MRFQPSDALFCFPIFLQSLTVLTFSYPEGQLLPGGPSMALFETGGAGEGSGAVSYTHLTLPTTPYV